MWLLKGKIYYLYGIKMTINSFIGSLLITFFVCVVVLANIIELVEIIKEKLKQKQWRLLR